MHSRSLCTLFFLYLINRFIYVFVNKIDLNLHGDVYSGSVVVTAFDFESGRRVRILSGGQYTIRLRSLHMAYPSLYPFGIVH